MWIELTKIRWSNDSLEHQATKPVLINMQQVLYAEPTELGTMLFFSGDSEAFQAIEVTESLEELQAWLVVSRRVD